METLRVKRACSDLFQMLTYYDSHPTITFILGQSTYNSLHTRTANLQFLTYYDSQPTICTEKLSALIERERKCFHGTNSWTNDIQQIKPMENRGSCVSGWREEWAQQRDCGKNRKAIITKTQNTMRTQTTPKVNNMMTKTNTHILIITLNIHGFSSPVKDKTDQMVQESKPIYLLPTWNTLQLCRRALP